MATALRPEEQWARQMIAGATGCSVEQHDDGSDRGMHDLDILGLHKAAAVEVVADIDQQRHELWQVIDDQPWTIAPGLGSWFVTLEQQARVKTLRSELPALITFLVSHARSRLDVPGWPIEDAGVLTEPEEQSLREARSLGIRNLRRYEQPPGEPGKIWLAPPPSGGVVDREGTAVSSWIAEYLSDPRRTDVRQKLARSGAAERHAFVIVPSSTTAPVDVVLYLMSEDRVPPMSSPILPQEITDVWIVDTFATFEPTGIRWSPGLGWRTFEKVFNDR